MIVLLLNLHKSESWLMSEKCMQWSPFIEVSKDRMPQVNVLAGSNFHGQQLNLVNYYIIKTGSFPLCVFRFTCYGLTWDSFRISHAATCLIQ